jgi:single-strand DNA-binding protein
MPTLNQCSFIGRLGKDPEMSSTPSGKSVTKFSMAVDQGKEQKAMWLNITCWDKLAETVNQYARKGMLVFVQGKLQVREYKGKSESKQVSVEIIASLVQLLEKRQSAGDDEADLV